MNEVAAMAKDEKMVRFGQRLRELREAQGMSRQQLADSMKLSERAVIQWELGEREPGWFNVLALCAALGASCEAFTIAPKDAPAAERGRPRKTPAPDRPGQGTAAPVEGEPVKDNSAKGQAAPKKSKRKK